MACYDYNGLKTALGIVMRVVLYATTTLLNIFIASIRSSIRPVAFCFNAGRGYLCDRPDASRRGFRTPEFNADFDSCP